MPPCNALPCELNPLDNGGAPLELNRPFGLDGGGGPKRPFGLDGMHGLDDLAANVLEDNCLRAGGAGGVVSGSSSSGGGVKGRDAMVGGRGGSARCAVFFELIAAGAGAGAAGRFHFVAPDTWL